MPKLARLRFVSIGHPNARMQDLTLNLTDQSGVPSDSTIWLRNGGGKSSILSLFFALPRPNRRDFLGSRADARQRRIEDYILTNDRSVVAAEWTLDTQALSEEFEPTELPRFLTGVFYEYAGGNQESLRRLFFSVRVSDAVAETLIPTIPIDMPTSNGGVGRRTLMSFRQQWRQLADEHPSLQFYCTENQSEWSEKLQSAGLDPGLFGYQLIMNSREGGADELFRFNSPDDFIDFLLELTVEPSRADGITENLETYRKQLQRRKHELLPDLTLSTGLVERLTPLVELHDRRLRVMEEAGRLTDLHTQIRQSIESHTAAFVAQEAAKNDDIRKLRVSWNDMDARVQRDKALASAIALRIAQQDVERAAKRVEDLTEEVAQAKRDETLWHAAYPYRDYVIAQKDAESFRERLSGAKDDREPLMKKIAEVASDYVAAMRHQIAALQAQRAEIRQKYDACDEESRQLDADAQRLEQIAFALESERKSYLKNIEERHGEFEGLLKLGIMQHDETPAAALTRTQDKLKSTKSKLRALERSREGNAELEDDYAQQILDLQKSTATKKAEISSLERDYQKGQETREKLESDCEFLSMLELSEIDLDEVADDTAAVLQRRASELQEQAARLRTEAASLERARVHINEHGLMPPSVEVEALLAFLGPKSPAKSGWAYLNEQFEDNPQERERLVRTYPAIAQGIIVPARDIERIRKQIESSPENIPQLPVIISTPEAFEVIPEVSEKYQCVVGPKDHAWYDKVDAQKALATLESRLNAIDDDIQKTLQSQESYINAAMKFKAFRAQYPRGWFASTKAKLAQMRVVYDDDNARLDMQNDEKKRLIDRRRSDEKEATRLNNEILALDRACERLSKFVNELDDSVDTWRAAADEKLRESQIKHSEAEGLRVQARQNRERGKQILQSTEPVAAQISLLENEISRVKYLPASPEPKQGNIEDLKSEYARILDRIEREYSNNELMRSLEQAEKQAASARKQVNHLIKGILTIDEVREAVEGLVNPNDLEANGERAAEMLTIVTNRKEQAVAELSRLESVKQQRQNAWYGAGKPSIPDDVEISKESVEKFEKQAAAGADELKHIDDAIRECERVIASAKHSREALAKDLERLSSVQRSHANFLKTESANNDLPDIDPAEIGAAISDLEVRLEKYKEAHGSLDSTRKSAVANIRKWVENEQFAELQNRIIPQFKSLDPESLENAAAEYREQLNIRLRELTATLEEMEKHRSMLAKFLLTAADDGLRLLKLADSASIVPKEVPDIGGSRFLRITTKESSSQSDRLELIQELVDTLVDETTLPTGVKLIQRAVRQIARPFNVRVLNPDPASPQHLIDIIDTARFSGGEQLTCAILLYCTLANVRARTRGMNRQPTSVLILDNPIGRASRTVFINMQRQFASAMGIQLIYTTAVNDLEALSILPNVVRLRNERTDLNRGHRLLEHDVEISGRLEAIRMAQTERQNASDDADDTDGE